jgi:hypothetical protein
MKNVYSYALFVWILFVLIATINGVVRDNYYSSDFNESSKHQISSVILIFLILSVMHIFFNKMDLAYTKKDLWLIGIGWLVLTIIFEFVLGHYVIGKSTELLYADYNIFKGRFWGLVLFFMLVGPRFVAKQD